MCADPYSSDAYPLKNMIDLRCYINNNNEAGIVSRGTKDSFEINY